MRNTKQTLSSFQPCINKCTDPEPVLHEMLTYYFQQGFDRNEAEKLADEYLTKLTKELIKG